MQRNKLFEKICCKTQPELKKWLKNRLEILTKSEIISGDGYLFYEGTFPVLLTAHMDTVHRQQVKRVMYSTNKAGNTVASSPVGIGGDDRCGVYMILKILEQIDCSVIFCEDEEIGSVGARKFVKTDLCKRLKDEKKFKYIIELDRMDADDAVFYEDDNKEFHNFVTEKFWKESYGSWSDICELSPALKISSVNLSCGYYHQHTTLETVVLEEMETAIKETISLLMRTDLDAEPFEYIECTYGYRGAFSGIYSGGRSSYLWDYYDDDYSFVSNSYTSKSATVTELTTKKTPTISDEFYLEAITSDGNYYSAVGETEDEAWKNLFMNNPTLCFCEIVDWYTY